VRVLVYCANGFQGQPIVRQLLSSGYQVRALIRDRTKAAPLAAAGAEIVTADLDADDLTILERAHEDVDYVVLQLVAGDDETGRRRKGQKALACIKRVPAIKGVIFNASVQYPKHIDELPTWVATREIETALRSGSVPVSTVHPTFLLQNLLLPYATYSIVTQGALTYPVEARHAFAWVSAEDIARLIDHLLRHQAMGVVALAGGKRALDGNELAQSFSDGLGRPIRYQSLNLDDFEHSIDQAIGPGVGKRISAIFRFIERHPDDLAFLARPFVQPEGVGPFECTDVAKWVAAHRTDFTAQPVATGRSS
jgi:uncharacterized protein YbjT (DUF2867 family)